MMLALLATMLAAAPPENRAGPPTPPDSPLTMQDVMSSPLYRGLSTAKLREGDPAFEFTLPRLDQRSGVARPTGRSVSLGSFRGRKPVALIFGSYT
jgi:hypothetical protein